MEMKKLDFAETLKDSIAIGVKNAPSVVVDRKSTRLNSSHRT